MRKYIYSRGSAKPSVYGFLTFHLVNPDNNFLIANTPMKNRTGGSKICPGILHLRNEFRRALGASRGCSPERVWWCERSWRFRFYEIPAESPEIAWNEGRERVERSRNLVDAYQCSREFSLRIERSHAITLDSRVPRSVRNAPDFLRAFPSCVRPLVVARQMVPCGRALFFRVKERVLFERFNNGEFKLEVTMTLIDMAFLLNFKNRCLKT